MTYTDKIKDMRSELRELNTLIPETAKGFGALSKAVKDNGPLSTKEKEYVALGMAIVMHSRAGTSWRQVNKVFVITKTAFD